MTQKKDNELFDAINTKIDDNNSMNNINDEQNEEKLKENIIKDQSKEEINIENIVKSKDNKQNNKKKKILVKGKHTENDETISKDDPANNPDTVNDTDNDPDNDTNNDVDRKQNIIKKQSNEENDMKNIRPKDNKQIKKILVKGKSNKVNKNVIKSNIKDLN